MDFNIESRNNSTLIQIQSEKLDTHIAPAVKSELVLVSGKGEKNIILDLEKCQYCDSSGLSAILVANRLCKNAGGTFVLCGLNVRYARDYRNDLESLSRVLLPLPDGRGQIPMSEIADVKLVEGPSMIRDENGLLAGYVFVDFDPSKVDVGSYVEEAKKAVTASVKTPTGYALIWSGQYENMLRVQERLKFIVPLTLVLIFALLYMNTKSSFKSLVVMLAVPFSAVGAIWLLYILGYNMSIAVWVGLIALLGLDAETGVSMVWSP